MKLIIILFAALFCISSYSNYSTPGTGRSWNLDSLVNNSGGVVTFSFGEYFINDTLIISTTDTLKILTNSTVKLLYNVVFSTLGTLIINPPDSVKFTSADTTQKFYELRLDDLSDASILKKMIFEYSFNGLRLLDTSPLIDSCIFRYNCGGNSSITVPVINLFRSNSVISNCRIYRNYKAAIGGGSNIANAPQILFNEIYENNISNGNVPQINLGQSGSGTTLIKGNIIRGLYTNTGGIAAFPIGTLNIRIEDNIITHNRYGMTLTNANINAVIKNNIVDSNNIQGLPNLGGSGLNFNGGSSITAIVSGNKIRGNLWGITIQGTAKPNFGNTGNPDTNDDGLNEIYNNVNNDTIFDLYNNTPDSIKAENNYWGIDNEDSVEAHIYHKHDNPLLGFVDFLPLVTVIGISGINSVLPETFELYNAYPNPFNPVTKIKFDLPRINHQHEGIPVKMVIYDLLGREVAVLVNKELKAGKYEVTFIAGSHASGVYFCSLSGGKYIKSMRIVLIK